MKTLLMFLMALTAIGPASAGNAPPLACNLGAFTKSERAKHDQLAQSMWAAVQETKELANGYAFRLPADQLVPVAQWAALERRCCPFFGFEIALASNGGPVWLSVTGREGVKDFIRAELGLK